MAVAKGAVPFGALALVEQRIEAFRHIGRLGAAIDQQRQTGEAENEAQDMENQLHPAIDPKEHRPGNHAGRQPQRRDDRKQLGGAQRKARRNPDNRDHYSSPGVDGVNWLPNAGWAAKCIRPSLSIIIFNGVLDALAAPCEDDSGQCQKDKDQHHPVHQRCTG